MKGHLAALLLAAAMAGLAFSSAPPLAPARAVRVFTVDVAASRVLIGVGRSGVFGFAGHDHEVLAPALSGKVTADDERGTGASITLEFDASKLKVTGKGEPAADVPDVERTMLGERVLDVKRFPVIAFRSRRVTATPAASGIALVIEGDFTLHGVTRPLTVRAMASVTPAGLTARGSCAIRQTDFGITPVAAAGGTVKVKNELSVTFVIQARPG